jgi:mannosyltransferase
MFQTKSFTRLIFLTIGFALLCLAATFSSADYSRILLGETAKDLSWGPTLFRALLVFHGVLLIVVGLTWERFFTNEPIAKAETSRISLSTLIAMVVLSVVALALRVWNLNSDLWVDEVFTLLDFARQPFGLMLTSFPSQNQHLLYSILAHASIETFGESAWALRLPSVLFGVASIWALFLLIKKLLGEREALLGCALMTVSYHHIWFSQNARGYMGLLLFTLLATWLWFEALEKNDWKWWLGYAAAVVFGMWIHITMAFVIAAHGIVFLALLINPRLSGVKDFSLERRAGIRPFAAWFLSVTVTLQLYALALPEFLRVGLHEESKNSEWTNPLWVLTETLQNLSIGFAGIAVVVCGAAFVAFGWVSLFKKNRRAAMLMILPPIFAGSLMLALGHNLFPRFFFFAMGFGLLIVIHGAMDLPRLIANFRFQISDSKLAYVGIGLVLLVISASIVTVPRNYSLPKQNFSGAKNYVENHRLPNEEIVAVSIAGEMYGKYFAPDWSVAKTVPELERVEQINKKVWLVYTLSPEIKAFRPEMWQAIQKDYEIVQVFPGTLNGGEIFVCQKRNVSEDTNESSRNFYQIENNTVR